MHHEFFDCLPIFALDYTESETWLGTSLGGTSAPMGIFPDVCGQELQHKSLVEPIFLAYKRVSSGEGERITLMQIACSVVEALADRSAVDAVQPMRTGWLIYIRTQTDCDRLVSQGLIIAGKHVQLRSKSNASQKKMVKITICDLPVHAVDNEQVLEAVSASWPVVSEVLYSTVWYEGQPTSIHYGDQYIYVTEEVAASMPEILDVGEYVARVFKPLVMMKCRHCGEPGHKASSPSCTALAPEAIAGTIETVRGGKNPLSNLHTCPEGCLLQDGQYDFPSAKHHYQFKRLRFHRKLDDSYCILEVESGFQAMKIAHESLPQEESNDKWKAITICEMMDTNLLKYRSCPYVKASLLDSKVIVAEATSDKFWGSGINPEMTRMTLSDYWPGKNNLGKILV